MYFELDLDHNAVLMIGCVFVVAFITRAIIATNNKGKK